MAVTAKINLNEFLSLGGRTASETLNNLGFLILKHMILHF